MSQGTQPHGVSDIVISCIDYRFRPRVAAWIAQNLGDASDLVAVAGASKAFLDPSSRDYLLQQIDIAIRLHGITRVHLLDHIDCGAYGGSGLHADEAAETSFHAEQCALAQQVIAAKFPTLTVVPYVVGFETTVVLAEKRLNV